MQYRFDTIAEDEITASDLRSEIEACDGHVECASITLYKDEAGTIQEPESAQAVYIPETDRIGIAWGADAQWADAASLEAGIEMWANDPEAFALAN